MPTSLDALHLKLAVRVRSLDKAFDRHITKPKVFSRIDRFALHEGLVSPLWQAWCWFCRNTIICSAKGAHTALGVLTTSGYSQYQEMEIAYIAKKFSQNQSVGRVRSLRGNHQEPTWGDAEKLNRMALGISSSNSSTLTSAFSACSTIKDLQLCRNANAHICSDTINQMQTARTRYDDTMLVHPSDMIMWIETSTQNYLWKAWVDEIILISQIAIK